MEDLEPEPGRVRQMESRRHRQQREHQRHKSGKVAAPFHLWFFLYEVESAPIAIRLKLHFASFQNLKELTGRKDFYFQQLTINVFQVLLFSPFVDLVMNFHNLQKTDLFSKSKHNTASQRTSEQMPRSNK